MLSKDGEIDLITDTEKKYVLVGGNEFQLRFTFSLNKIL